VDLKVRALGEDGMYHGANHWRNVDARLTDYEIVVSASLGGESVFEGIACDDAFLAQFTGLDARTVAETALFGDLDELDIVNVGVHEYAGRSVSPR